MKHKIIFILIFIGFNTLAAPDSTIDFKASINSEAKIAEGIYRITHKAPRFLFSASRSWKGLNKRAASLCKRTDYLLIDKKTNNCWLYNRNFSRRIFSRSPYNLRSQ